MNFMFYSSQWLLDQRTFIYPISQPPCKRDSEFIAIQVDQAVIFDELSVPGIAATDLFD